MSSQRELNPVALAIAFGAAAMVAGVLFLAPFVNAMHNQLGMRPPMVEFMGVGFHWAWIGWYVVASALIGAMIALVYNAVVRSGGRD